MKKNFLTVIATVAILFFTGCGQPAEKPLKEGSITDYSLSFFKNTVGRQDKNENVFVSPYSAGVALSMLAEGAAGETLEELKTALNGLDFTEYAPVADTAADVRVANSLWIKEGFPVKKDFVTLLSDKYSAQAECLDFSSAASVDLINKWCSEKTEGRIPEILDRIDADMVLFLMNALYFKAPWKTEFDSKRTSDNLFYGSLRESKIPYMNATDEFGYAEYKGCQLVSLPYSGDRYSMLVLLPAPGMMPDEILPYLNEETYSSAVSAITEKKISLTLPKFKMETTVQLNGTFSAMGVNRVFSRSAELGGITSSRVAVDQIKQKCFIEVNEAGSEAAAVTSIGVRLTSVKPQASVPVVVVNRPFVFAITDNKTGNLLFTGKIMNL